MPEHVPGKPREWRERLEALERGQKDLEWRTRDLHNRLLLGAIPSEGTAAVREGDGLEAELRRDAAEWQDWAEDREHDGTADRYDMLRTVRLMRRAADAIRPEQPSPERATPSEAGEPRELLCMKCGREHPVWSAHSPLWNRTVRRPDGSEEFPFLCPTCFMVLAEERGVASMFFVSDDASAEPSAWLIADSDGAPYGAELDYYSARKVQDRYHNAILIPLHAHAPGEAGEMETQGARAGSAYSGNAKASLRGKICAPGARGSRDGVALGEREANPHPDYGPCDGFGEDGACSECGTMVPGELRMLWSPQQLESVKMRAEAVGAGHAGEKSVRRLAHQATCLAAEVERLYRQWPAPHPITPNATPDNDLTPETVPNPITPSAQPSVSEPEDGERERLVEELRRDVVPALFRQASDAYHRKSEVAEWRRRAEAVEEAARILRSTPVEAQPDTTIGPEAYRQGWSRGYDAGYKAAKEEPVEAQEPVARWVAEALGDSGWEFVGSWPGDEGFRARYWAGSAQSRRVVPLYRHPAPRMTEGAARKLIADFARAVAGWSVVDYDAAYVKLRSYPAHRKLLAALMGENDG